jgi:xanthine dehydrogenase accessory factor
VRDVLDDLDAWLGRGDRVALATVVDVKRSAPRPPGAKMAINDRGEVSGAVSGGCVEGAVVEITEEVLGGGEPRLLHFGIADSDAWDVGLPCGGEIDVWVQAEAHAGFADLAREGGRGALVTVLRGDGAGSRVLVRADGTADGDLDPTVLAQAEELMWAERSELLELGDRLLFIDVTHPAPRLIVFGAVDFAAALVHLARGIGWRPYVVDPRSRFATRERFPGAEDVVVAWPDEALRRLGGIDRATSVVVLTHDPKLDDAALTIALRSDAVYVGAMGSRRAQAARRERLLAAGLTDAELERLAAPTGLDLGATSSEETALSILSEVVAVRNGRDGGRLARAGGRIHEVGA